MSKEKPNWWPDNPYPESVFPMAREEYPEVVPDPHKRCALSGMLGREFWGIASRSIWDALQNELEMAPVVAEATDTYIAELEGQVKELVEALEKIDTCEVRTNHSTLASALCNVAQAALAKYKGGG